MSKWTHEQSFKVLYGNVARLKIQVVACGACTCFLLFVFKKNIRYMPLLLVVTDSQMPRLFHWCTCHYQWHNSLSHQQINVCGVQCLRCKCLRLEDTLVNGTCDDVESSYTFWLCLTYTYCTVLSHVSLIETMSYIWLHCSRSFWLFIISSSRHNLVVVVVKLLMLNSEFMWLVYI